MVSHGNSSGGGGSREGKSSRQGSTASPGSQGMKKGPWTTAEDGILMEYVNKYGEGNWNAVQRNSGLQRCGKSCRLRWANHLRPNLKKGAFSPEEERLILELHAKLGNKWARMASQLPGRTDNEIKNYWNTRVKRLQRAGLPIYPDNIHRQVHGQHQQFICQPPTSSSSPFSSLISVPRTSNSNFGINPSLSAFFTSPGSFQTVAPFHNPPLVSQSKPQFTIFRDNDDPSNNNYNPNVMPLVSSPNMLYTHQNFHQKDQDLDRHPPLPTNPFQFNFDGIDHHPPNLFAGCKETELPSIQSPVGATPVSSSSAGGAAGDHLMGTASSGDFQYYEDIVPHHEVANSGLLEALLEESKALLNKENSSSGTDYNQMKDICRSIDEIADHHDPSPAQSSISLNEKDALEEMNPIDDDLSSLLNNFPLTVPVPDWYEESAKNSNKQSSNISDVSSSSINNRREDSNVPTMNTTTTTTPTSEEDDWSSLNPYWNNMPGIC